MYLFSVAFTQCRGWLSGIVDSFAYAVKVGPQKASLLSNVEDSIDNKNCMQRHMKQLLDVVTTNLVAKCSKVLSP